jgi:hypothetical protein
MLEFDWDEANIAHIARHGVKPHEAEEVILNEPIDLAYVVRNGEERIEQIGETLAGRILTVVSMFRTGKIRVVTARPLRSRYRGRYLKMKEERNAGEQSPT